MKTKLFSLFFLIISATGFAQKGQNSIDKTFELLKAQENISYFDVTQKMFEMLAETKDASAEFKDYMRKLSGMKMVRASNQQNKIEVDIYKLFMNNANLKDFSRLMTSETPTKKISFFQKKSSKMNEYLLVQTNAIIYITGTLDLKSISEFEQVMEIAGGAMGM